MAAFRATWPAQVGWSGSTAGRGSGRRTDGGVALVDRCCATRYTTCMTGSQNRSAEVGRYIRQQVIPQGMSVAEAARRLGVGRPALSNLLNGRATLSQTMALRLEATFGANRAELLELQAASDRDRRRVEDRAVAVGTYAPDFLTIKARQIADWAASNIQARERLPVLLRQLIHSTGRELREVDFPGYDNAQRHGWDGWVDAGAAAPWVPEGRSGWELSVEQRPREKAERDYRARLNKFSPAERAECAFVFVTPRNWEGKTRWARDKRDAGEWKAVRAFDASDLEQWLETTISPRIWLAHELNMPTTGFETLDRFWSRWAAASDPPMTDAIFAPSIGAHLDAFKKWLATPSDRHFRVAADSKEEAVAFLACLLRHDDAPADAYDRSVVFESASTLRTLAQSSSPFIPIVYNEECEREIATVYRQHHCIVVRPRNAVDREPDLAIELLNHSAFKKALADMGIGPEDVDRLARESGRSPTVLRRRLSQNKTPSWAGDAEVARRLIPAALVGVWHCGSKADREVLATLADCEYETTEENIADLLRHEDCPVWRVDQYCGVVSKIDALFAISQRMTKTDVTDFMVVAEYVLSETDPALELPEAKRWAAGLYGKVREHSSALRTGICETLVLLAVHGNGLFRERLGIDVAKFVADLVTRLLVPFTIDKLRSQDRDLPGYAEAAPDELLALFEKDLRRRQPALQEVLTPTEAGLFSHPARTGVLWALERLAWNPQTFPRVVRILAKLSQTEIEDNWVNKPMNSLSAVFRSWLPQTAAPLDDRVKALEAICGSFPDVGWKICLQQFESHSQLGHFSDRPHWRNDGSGRGRGVSERERYEFARKSLDLALAWPVHDEDTLGDLVTRLEGMADRDQLLVWKLIKNWSREGTEKARTALREKIRLGVLTERGLITLSADQRDRARRICKKLVSSDSVRRHAWLFVSPWVQYSADEVDENLDLNDQKKRIDDQREQAMKEIWAERQLDGIFPLLADSDAWTVGRYAARCATGTRVVVHTLQTCLSITDESSEKLNAFMQGFISCMDDDAVSAVVSALAETGTVEQRVRLFKCAPFCNETWRLLDRQDTPVRDRYWREVVPRIGRFSESEATELVDRLLETRRPWEAFLAVRFDWNKVETSRLKRLLSAIVECDSKATGHRVVFYQIMKALDSLDGRAGVSVDEMAQLEFSFIDVLDRDEHGIPNLEAKLADSPGLFVQVLALVFGRSDNGQDPPEWHVDGSRSRARAADRLLQKAARVPGTDPDGKVDVETLRQWVAEARRLCSEHGRTEIGDEKIGQLLSRAPFEEDGSWPCRSVCEVMEAAASPGIASGFEIGVFNGRGVVSRGTDEGGAQERALSGKYRAWARRRAFDYPYVADILERIAKGYDRDAEREDSEVQVWNRLHH